ncbi:hypothetical protein BSQ33_07885 [Vibrio gazogenes]|nr:hypothetical protein BSQ33_07885 [Vibrio gazogenes]
MGTLNFRLVSGVGEALVVRDYQGHESVSDSHDAQGNPVYGFRYHIELASRDSSISAEQLVDTTAVLEVIRDGEVVQQVHGIVRSFSRGDTGHHHTYYSLTLVPALERLSLRHNSRIFQHKTVPEILAILLDEMHITDYAFSVKRECAPREFCVQYRETDLAFFHRLAAEEGLMYTFSHESEKHTLIVTDNSAGFTQLGGTVPYNVLSGGVAETPYVSAISETKQSEVTEVAMRDYSFKKPDYNFKQSALGSDMAYQLPDYQHYDAPGRYKDDASGKAFSQIRLESLRRASHTASGKSNQAKLQAGVVFTLADHLDSTMNRPWLIVGIDHQGSQPQALEESGGSGATTYSNQFVVIPNETLWRMQPHPKPQVDGPMVATVVGPQGEEIYCDEHGRVKLSFPWDRYSNEDEHSSCWVRVAQGWAGAQYGMVALPRVGHEVIVTFLNGDPDQPLVTGRTYHATNTPPYSLPDNKTKTVIRTQTHQGTGFNELSFEDQSGSEKIYLHAQKDYEALVENDSTTQIKHDRHLTVENDRYSHVQVNDHLSIDGEQRTAIKQNLTLATDASLHQKVGQKTIVDSGSEVHLKAGKAVVLDAGNEITVKVGGSFIKVDAGGVHVVSGAINLNSGGSAGSGSGYGGQPATMPNILKALTPPEEAQAPSFAASEVQASPQLIPYSPNLIQQVEADMLTGTPITPVCKVPVGGPCPFGDFDASNMVAMFAPSSSGSNSAQGKSETESKEVALTTPVMIFETKRQMDDMNAKDMHHGDYDEQTLKEQFDLRDVSAKLNAYTGLKFPEVYPGYYGGYSRQTEEYLSLAERSEIMFDEFRDLAKMFSWHGAYKNVINEMITHMQKNTGEPFSSPLLDQALKEQIEGDDSENSSLQHIKDALIKNIEWSEGIYPEAKEELLTSEVGRSILPRFDDFKDYTNGLVICVHDIWSAQITLQSLQVSGNQFTATVHYRVQDHFGLDDADISNWAYRQARIFRLWFVLQRWEQFDFKPFITEMNATVTIKGTRI